MSEIRNCAEREVSAMGSGRFETTLVTVPEKRLLVLDVSLAVTS